MKRIAAFAATLVLAWAAHANADDELADPTTTDPPTLPPPTQTAAPARVYAPPPVESEDPPLSANVIGYYARLQIGLSPGLVFFTNTSKVGFSLGANVGYGIEAAGLVFIPSMHALGIFASGATVLAGIPSGGVVIPLGPVGVRIEGGVGAGTETQSGKAGIAYRGLLSLSVHPTPRTAFGLGAEYTNVSAANLSVIGPVLILAF